VSVPETQLEATLNALRAAGKWPVVVEYRVNKDGSTVAIVEVQE
jgi:hypothetical protein